MDFCVLRPRKKKPENPKPPPSKELVKPPSGPDKSHDQSFGDGHLALSGPIPRNRMVNRMDLDFPNNNGFDDFRDLGHDPYDYCAVQHRHPKLPPPPYRQMGPPPPRLPLPPPPPCHQMSPPPLPPPYHQKMLPPPRSPPGPFRGGHYIENQPFFQPPVNHPYYGDMFSDQNPNGCVTM